MLSCCAARSTKMSCLLTFHHPMFNKSHLIIHTYSCLKLQIFIVKPFLRQECRFIYSVAQSLPLILHNSLHFPASPLQPWRWRQYISPKHWHLPTSLHGTKIQKNNIIIKITLLGVLYGCGSSGIIFSVLGLDILLAKYILTSRIGTKA
jgi:hypothetical protein